jgi:hypothetical protein
MGAPGQHSVGHAQADRYVDGHQGAQGQRQDRAGEERRGEERRGKEGIKEASEETRKTWMYVCMYVNKQLFVTVCSPGSYSALLFFLLLRPSSSSSSCFGDATKPRKPPSSLVVIVVLLFPFFVFFYLSLSLVLSSPLLSSPHLPPSLSLSLRVSLLFLSLSRPLSLLLLSSCLLEAQERGEERDLERGERV